MFLFILLNVSLLFFLLKNLGKFEASNLVPLIEIFLFHSIEKLLLGLLIWKFLSDKQPQLIEDGGWHFSFLKKPKDIKHKINSYSHQEFNTPQFTNIKNIEERILKGEDLFNRNIKYRVIKIDDNFPKYIVEKQERYKDWIV